MGAAVVIAVVVAAGELSSPVTTALLSAAQESLGPAAVVHLVEDPEPARLDPIGVERELGARAVAVLLWREPEHLHAVLRVHISGTAGWTVRSISFSPEDSLAERGRHLGLAISSASPELAQPQPGPSDVAPADQTVPAKPAESVPAAGAKRDSPVAAPTESPAPKPWFRDQSLAIGASAVAGTALGGSGSSAGARIDVVVPIGGTLDLYFAGEMRTGPVAALSGTDLVALVAGGLEWWPTVGRWTGFGGRAALIVIRDQVTGHAMGFTETHARVQPATEIAGQLAVHLSGRIDLVLALGLELAFGSTELRTGSTPMVVATIPPLRAMTHLGLRVAF